MRLKQTAGLCSSFHTLCQGSSEHWSSMEERLLEVVLKLGLEEGGFD